MIEEEGVALVKKWALREVAVPPGVIVSFRDLFVTFRRAFLFPSDVLLLQPTPAEEAVGEANREFRTGTWWRHEGHKTTCEGGARQAVQYALCAERSEVFSDPTGRLAKMRLIARQEYNPRRDNVVASLYLTYARSRRHAYGAWFNGQDAEQVAIIRGFIAGGAWGAMLDLLSETCRTAAEMTKHLIKREET